MKKLKKKEGLSIVVVGVLVIAGLYYFVSRNKA